MNKKNYYSRPTKNVFAIQNNKSKLMCSNRSVLNAKCIKMLEEESDDQYKLITGISLYSCFKEVKGNSGTTYLYNSN